MPSFAASGGKPAASLTAPPDRRSIGPDHLADRVITPFLARVNRRGLFSEHRLTKLSESQVRAS
jgi:hypothetical protein